MPLVPLEPEVPELVPLDDGVLLEAPLLDEPEELWLVVPGALADPPEPVVGIEVLEDEDVPDWSDELDVVPLEVVPLEVAPPEVVPVAVPVRVPVPVHAARASAQIKGRKYFVIKNLLVCWQSECAQTQEIRSENSLRVRYVEIINSAKFRAEA